MNEQITHGDVLEIIEALREQGKRLRRLAASRSYTGPANAVYRQGLRKRAGGRRSWPASPCAAGRRSCGPAMSARRPPVRGSLSPRTVARLVRKALEAKS
jgi:hypothetical protein